MNTQIGPRRPDSATLAGQIGRCLTAALRRRRTMSARRREARHIVALPEYLLRDMGLTRAEIVELID